MSARRQVNVAAYFIDRLLRIALGEDLEAQDPGRDHGR
jgi:hypothetical protein